MLTGARAGDSDSDSGSEAEDGSQVVAATTLRAVKAHDKDINCLAVSPNDKLIASASQDKLVKVRGWLGDGVGCHVVLSLVGSLPAPCSTPGSAHAPAAVVSPVVVNERAGACRHHAWAQARRVGGGVQPGGQGSGVG